MRIFFLVSGLFCLFLGWNMPNHYPPYPSFHSELMAAAALVLLAMSVAVWSDFPRHAKAWRGASFTRPRSAIAWALVALVPLAQWIGGMLNFRADAAYGLAYGLGAAVAIEIGHLMTARFGRIAALRWMFGAIVAGAVAANGFAFAQWLGLPASGWWATPLIGDRPFGNLAQSNHFGLLATWGVVAATALFELRAIRNALVFALLAAFLGSGILISQSRAAALAFLLVIACWFVTRRRVSTRLWPGIVVGAMALWLLVYWQFDHIQELVLPYQTGRDRLDGGVRPVMWHHFLTAIAAHPWFGYGFNQGVAALAEVATQLAPSDTRSTVYAHNFVLDLAVWGGVPLALILVGALSYWVLGWLRASEDLVWQQHRQLVFAVWLVLLMQSLLEYPYAYAYFLLPAALLAGVATNRHAEPDASLGLPTLSFMVVAGIALALLIAIVRDYSYLEEDFRQARFARANYLNRDHHDYLDKPWVLDLVATSNRTALQDLHPGMSIAELDEMRSVARRVQNPAVQIDYAKALFLNGRSSEAQHELEILRSIYSPESFAAIENEWRTWLAERAR